MSIVRNSNALTLQHFVLIMWMENHKHILYVICDVYLVASHLKIMIPVDTAMIIVADANYALVSMSVPTVCDGLMLEILIDQSLV